MTTRRATILMPALLVLFMWPGISRVHAIEPRFELDPALLRRNLPTPVEKQPEPKPAESIDAVRAKKAPRRATLSNKRRSGETGRARLSAAKRGSRTVAATRGKKVRRYRVKSADEAADATLKHGMPLFMASPGASGNPVAVARRLWDKLAPEAGGAANSFSVKGTSFSLDLDPERYPVFNSLTGRKIVVETGGGLPPLVRSLIEQREPGVHFVPFTPGEPRRFVGELLSAAGFYSVGEDFSISFGTDPKLTVKSDFTVEKDHESSLRNDIFLLNVTNRGGYPPRLAEFMAGQGFKTVDLYPGGRESAPRGSDTIDIITEKEPSAMIDRLLTALRLRFEKDKGLDILNMGDAGVGLMVRADRYFEMNGERYVIGIFNGDPDNYTLLRLLESLRYNVVMLTPEDDFKRVSNTILSHLHLPGKYAMQELVPGRGAPYSIEMSGIMIDSPGTEGRLFITERTPGPVITELLKLNGYAVRNNGEEPTRR